ncbi:MAG TPA: MFS transporter [Morganella sp. (in: Bacteria)]|nr:MFS transporter [Morganella sp. (in: enterobacteria)]
MNDNKMTPSERRATWGLGSVFSLRMLGMFMVLPVITTFGLDLKDATSTLTGFAIGVYGLTQAIFQIPFGLLSDRIGRKPLIIAGLIIFIAGSLVAAFSDSIYGIIAGRALQGAGAISAAVMALLSDVTREQNRTKAMAFIGISIGITFAVALVLGPILADIVGLSGLFQGIALLAFLGIIVTLYVVPDNPEHRKNRETAIVKGAIKQVLLDKQLTRLNFGILALHTLLMATFVALPLVMSDAGLDRGLHWKAYLYTMLIAFVSVLPFIIYAEKYRKMKQVFICCVVMMMLAEVTFLLAGENLWLLYLGLQIFFIAFNVMEAILPSLISKEAPAGYKGTAMGIYSTSQFLGVALGGSLGGLLYNINGAFAVFGGGLALTLIWLAVSMTLRQPPYVSSIRLDLPKNDINYQLIADILRGQPGVSDVVIIEEERAAYIKTDTKLSNRSQLEAVLQG